MLHVFIDYSSSAAAVPATWLGLQVSLRHWSSSSLHLHRITELWKQEDI